MRNAVLGELDTDSSSAATASSILSGDKSLVASLFGSPCYLDVLVGAPTARVDTGRYAVNGGHGPQSHAQV